MIDAAIGAGGAANDDVHRRARWIGSDSSRVVQRAAMRYRFVINNCIDAAGNARRPVGGGVPIITRATVPCALSLSAIGPKREAAYRHYDSQEHSRVPRAHAKAMRNFWAKLSNH